MSASIKRPANSVEENPIKLSTFKANEHSLNKFKEWMTENSFNLSPKVYVGNDGSCAQYGAVALEDIEEGECLFQIQRSCLLMPQTSTISQQIQTDMDSLKSSSGWIPLLLSLMYEYNNPQSKWRPYLDLVPDFKQLDLPMFWTETERKSLLKSTGVIEAVDKDIKNISTEFNDIVLPFVKKHSDLFGECCLNLEFYKQMVAFVMAYSFTEPPDDEFDDSPPPMMVPMADILNHVAKNNAQLAFETDALKMVAIKTIKKGEEIYNTYGQLANWQLLQMYGFAEQFPNNHYDTVDIPISVVLEAAKELPINNEVLLKDKTNFLIDMELMIRDGSFVVGISGVLTEDEMYQVIRVLLMNEKEYKEHKEKDGWSEDEEEEEEESLEFEAIKKLPEKWKKFLCSCAMKTQNLYSNTLEEEKSQLLKAQTLSSRQLYSLYTTQGQKQILQQIIQATR
ncbi:N-lysine methyltransferase setd6-like [Mytilus californianus]|uniref:N-lysine methyltransferase setd6-like n=1 Tax=Mytilus californianus TaxID=6549 RepID=UPI002245DD81|nr:N-lysine methyltransferase setd6-like [Mytilus californianus]